MFKILQLCCFSNHWPDTCQVTSVDLRLGLDVLDLSDNCGKDFDLIVSAPPCDQFTKANSLSWINSPELFIQIARKCLTISELSGQNWFLENPPGRVESFLPGLTRYRLCTWHGNVTNKEYVIYSNFVMLFTYVKRYGKPGSINDYSKKHREEWQADFVQAISYNLFHIILPHE